MNMDAGRFFSQSHHSPISASGTPPIGRVQYNTSPFNQSQQVTPSNLLYGPGDLLDSGTQVSLHDDDSDFEFDNERVSGKCTYYCIILVAPNFCGSQFHSLKASSQLAKQHKSLRFCL